MELNEVFTEKEMQELPDKMAEIIFGDRPDDRTVQEIELRTKYIVEALINTFNYCIEDIMNEEEEK